jgi:hypothetical protein
MWLIMHADCLLLMAQDIPILPTGNTRIFSTGNIIFLDLFFSYDGLFKKAKNNKIHENT